MHYLVLATLLLGTAETSFIHFIIFRIRNTNTVSHYLRMPIVLRESIK